MSMIEYILSEWEKDCIIDDMRLDESSRETPRLHAKYLAIFSKTRLLGKKLEMDRKNLLKDKWLYYNGKMTKDDMDNFGWKYDPFDGMNKPLKTDMDHYYGTDKDIQNQQLKIDYNKELQDTLKEVMDNIKWRHQTIKNMIEWRKFTSGA